MPELKQRKEEVMELGKQVVSLLVLIGVLAGVLPAVAEREEESGGLDTNRVVRLGEILVVGTRIERNLLETPTVESISLDIATSVVDEEAIRLRNPGTLAKAMDISTGVFTEQRGRKEKMLTSFRGQIYPYPDFAFNGVWQRAFWEIPSFFPASAIDRVEILRSGGAILTGPNSGLVGSINIMPRRFDRDTTLFDIQAGKYGTLRTSVVKGGRYEDMDYTAGGEFYTTEGPKGENAAEHIGTVFGTGSWQPRERLRFEVTSFGMVGERELRKIKRPGMESLRNREEEYNPMSAYGGILRTLMKHSDEASTSVDLGYMRRDAHFRNKIEGRPRTKNIERDWEYNAGVMHAHKLAEENTLRVGAQYNHWYCPDGKRHFVGKRMDVHTISGVIVDEHQWDRLTLDAGFRSTHSWYRDYTESTFNITGANMSSSRLQNEWQDPTFTATLGAKYDLTDPLALYGHIAAGTLDTPPGAVSKSSSSLKRESRVLLDGGMMMEVPEIGSVKGGGFATLRQNALVLTETKVDKDGDIFNTYSNEEVNHYGLEVEGRTVRFMDTFSLFGNATLMQATRRERGKWRTFKEIPHGVVSSGINSVFGRCDLNLYGKYVSQFKNRRFAQDGAYHRLGNFIDIGVSGGVTLGKEKRTRIFASIENLLDDHYSTVVGFPDYGLQFFVGLQHRM